MSGKQGADADMASAVKPAAASGITLVAKWAKERIVVEDLNPETTIGAVKEMIKERTNILPKRQKLVGLVVNKSAAGGSTALTDQVMLSDLKVKKLKGKTNGLNSDAIVHEFILVRPQCRCCRCRHFPMTTVAHLLPCI